ncbi:unnamed protein product [Enterobius vermicularis]|uniref:ZnMc domain-containing protein n=1 Tax=Enterobius vermicularis TaxID=51028 RepID=A0A0N4VNL1_ENTVE|nr:unnamed protein product [Enterobius vermicularis]
MSLTLLLVAVAIPASFAGGIPRCGLVDREMDGVANMGAKWPKRRITYTIENYLDYLSENDTKKGVQEAFDQWSTLVPIKFQFVSSGGDVKISFGRLDGKWGMLAVATVGWARTNFLVFDTYERWTYKNVDEILKGYIDLYTIAKHEIGHVLGVEHNQDPLSVMAPYYNTPLNRTTRQFKDISFRDEDIRKIRSLYGGFYMLETV